MLRREILHQLETGSASHGEIRDDQIDRRIVHSIHRLVRIGGQGADDQVAFGIQSRGQPFANNRVIVDQENSRLSRCRISRRNPLDWFF